MSKQLKQVVVKDIEKRLKPVESYLLVDFRGLNSAQSFDLRRTLNEAKVRMRVVPNRLAVRVLDRWEGGKPEFKDLFKGPTAILYGTDGAITASRVVAQWKKKNKNLLDVKGGVLEGQIIEPSVVEKLSRIPDRPVLLAQVAGGFQAPLSRLAGALQQVIARVAYALDAHRKKVEAAGGGGAAAETSTQGQPESGGPAA